MAGPSPTLVAAVVGRISYFEGLDPPTLAAIARSLGVRSLAAGETVLVEGEPCLGLHVVLEGQVRLLRTSGDGREIVLGVLGPGATFNDAAVFDGGPNSAGAVAIGRTTCGVIPKAEMMRLVERDPGVAKAALRVLSARQRTLDNVVEDLATRDVTTRVARLFLGCIGRHDHIVDQAHDACARITHQEIASMVGSVREVVQRSLKELERDGAITLERGRVEVRDVARLELWAHPDDE